MDHIDENLIKSFINTFHTSCIYDSFPSEIC